MNKCYVYKSDLMQADGSWVYAVYPEEIQSQPRIEVYLASDVDPLLNGLAGETCTTPAVGGLNPTGRATYERGTTKE